MNTQMWSHPFTDKHIVELESIGYQVIYPISKVLMCGDVGTGAMESVQVISTAILDQIKWGLFNFWQEKTLQLQ